MDLLAFTEAKYSLQQALVGLYCPCFRTSSLTFHRRREDADNLPAEHTGYIFDLDSTEIRGQHTRRAKFSVDSYEYGMTFVRIFHMHRFNYIYL